MLQTSLAFTDVDPDADFPEFPGDSEEFPDQLAARGIDYFELRVTDYSATLASSDDATFIADAYADARRYALRGEGDARHVTYLGDGEVVVTAVIEGGRVRCDIRLCPHLDVRFVSSTRVDVSVRGYAHAWWRVVKQLLAAVDASAVAGTTG